MYSLLFKMILAITFLLGPKFRVILISAVSPASTDLTFRPFERLTWPLNVFLQFFPSSTSDSWNSPIRETQYSKNLLYSRQTTSYVLVGYLAQYLIKYVHFRASLVAQMVKNLPAMQETWVQFLGRGDPLEEGLATHASILAWRIAWTEESGGP